VGLRFSGAHGRQHFVGDFAAAGGSGDEKLPVVLAS